MSSERLISADSHVIEPGEMWAEYMDPSFRDRAPKIEIDPPGKTGAYFMAEGMNPRQVNLFFAAGLSAEEMKNLQDKGGIDDCRPGAYDPAERLKDMEIDGVDAEVIYTTLGFGLFGLTDAPYQQAIFRGYNTWLSELCSYAPQRLIGQGMISLLDVEEGIKELKRCSQIGLRGGTIMVSPPEGISYADPMYERFWATAEELGMPLSMHLGTGHGPESKALGKFKNDVYLLSMSVPHEMQRSLTEILFSGILERYPGIKFVSAENDVGWVPHYLKRADHYHEQRMHTYPTSLKMKPSEYLKRNLFLTFIDDEPGVKLAEMYGEDNYGWSSDYPHADSSFPNSHDVVDQNFAGMSDEIRRKMTRDNVIKLYNIDIN